MNLRSMQVSGQGMLQCERVLAVEGARLLAAVDVHFDAPVSEVNVRGVQMRTNRFKREVPEAALKIAQRAIRCFEISARQHCCEGKET